MQKEPVGWISWSGLTGDVHMVIWQSRRECDVGGARCGVWEGEDQKPCR